MKESLDGLGVGIHLCGIALLVDILEIQSVFLENLQWRLFRQRVEDFIDFGTSTTASTGEDLEFLGEYDIVEFCDFLNESLEELPTILDKLGITVI